MFLTNLSAASLLLTDLLLIFTPWRLRWTRNPPNSIQLICPKGADVKHIKSSNAVVKGGEVLLDLVPRNNALEVEAYIDPKDIGKIEVGQNARIGLTAYDSSKYGYIDGVLTNVSADAVFREDKNTYMFMITTKLNSSLVGSDGKIVPLNAGMIAQVDIIRGKQTLLEYFWQPVAKIKDDAFRQ